MLVRELTDEGNCIVKIELSPEQVESLRSDGINCGKKYFNLDEDYGDFDSGEYYFIAANGKDCALCFFPLADSFEEVIDKYLLDILFTLSRNKKVFKEETFEILNEYLLMLYETMEVRGLYPDLLMNGVYELVMRELDVDYKKPVMADYVDFIRTHDLAFRLMDKIN